MLGRRVAARLVDVLTVVFVYWAMVVLQVLGFVGPLSRSLRPQPWGSAFVPTVVIAALYGLYQVVFLWGNGGKTPGMEVCGLRVVMATSGRIPTAGRSAARWLLPGLAMLVPPVPLAAGLMALLGLPAAVDGRARTVADRLAGTVVVSFRAEEDPDRVVPRRRAGFHL